MQSQLDKRDLHDFEIRPRFTQVGENRIVGSAQWFDAYRGRQNRHVVLTIRNGKIADMQTCGSRRAAMRFAKRDRNPA